MSELLAPRCAVCRAPVSLYGETVAYHARAPIGARHAPLGSWMPCEGTGQPPAQERDVRPRAVLDAVAAILDGAEWSSDHLDDIARVLTAAGYVLRPAPQGGWFVTMHDTIPDGEYLCRVCEVRLGSTRAGDERWALRLVVASGPHVGRQAAWDSLVFSARGRARARRVFAALGLPANGRVQVDAADLEGREALVQVRAVEHWSLAGETVRRSEVPYDGWRLAPVGGDGIVPVEGDR